MSKKILITGATGNVGADVIRFLCGSDSENEIFAGVRNIEKSQKIFSAYSGLQYRKFDFEDISSFNPAFEGIDILFYCVRLKLPTRIKYSVH